CAVWVAVPHRSRISSSISFLPQLLLRAAATLCRGRLMTERRPRVECSAVLVEQGLVRPVVPGLCHVVAVLPACAARPPGALGREPRRFAIHETETAMARHSCERCAQVF